MSGDRPDWERFGLVPAHSVTIDRYRHGAAGAYRWRAECSCGWIGGVCSHHKTAEADGVDHLRAVHVGEPS